MSPPNSSPPPYKRKLCQRASVTSVCFLLAMAAIFCLWNYQEVTYWKIHCVEGDPQQQQRCLNSYSLNDAESNVVSATPTVKRILFWTPFFSSPDYYFGLGSEPFAQCPVSDCETTTDRSLLNSSHAIMFHFRNTEYTDLPRWRSPSQRWVFFLMESPSNTNPDLRPFNGLFNWTMTYRLDSDVVAQYAYVRPIGEAAPTTAAAAVAASAANSTKRTWRRQKKKRRLVSWLVSNCRTESRREDYVEELREHVPVDIFGGCYARPCVDCESRVYDRYKFYLSFENSICRDYVTEKFYKVLGHDTVPVVYGGADYRTVAPPMSYVDARDFASPGLLAEFLRALDGNDTLYRSYFRWKSRFRIESSMRLPFCDLCAKLHDGRQEAKTYEDIYDWWMTRGKCVSEIDKFRYDAADAVNVVRESV